MSGARDDFERIYEGRLPDDVSGNEFLLMVKLSNFFDNPKSPKFFKSMNAIARIFEQTTNPETMTRRVIDKMLKKKFIRITNSNELEFDEVAFDNWLEGCSSGKELWEYFGRHATYIKTK